MSDSQRSRRLAATVTRWRAAVAARKRATRAIACARDAAGGRLLSNVFVQWRRHTSRSARTRQGVALLVQTGHRQRLGKAFAAWQQAAFGRSTASGSQLRGGRTPAAADKWHQQRLLWVCWRALRAASVQGRALEGVGQAALLRRVVRRWHQHAARRTLEGAATAAAGRKAARALLLRGLRAWLQHAAACRAVQLWAPEAHKQRLALKCLRRWSAGMVQQQRLRQRVLVAVAAARRALVRRAFVAWSEAMQQTEATAAACAARRLECTLRRAWQAWRLRAHHSMAMRRFAALLMQRSRERGLRAGFRAWRSLAADAAQARSGGGCCTVSIAAVAAAAVARRRRQQMRQVLQHWQGLAARAAQAGDAASRMQGTRSRQLQAAAVASWRRSVADSKCRQQLLRRAIAHMVHAELATAFAGWLAAVRQRQRRRQLLAHCIRRMCSIRAAAAFGRWVQHVAQLAAARAAAEQLARTCERQQLAYAMSAWQGVRAGREAQLQAAVLHRQRHVGSSVLLSWRRLCCKNTALLGCLQRVAASRQQRVLLAWRAAAARQLRLKRLAASAAAHSQAALLRLAMAAWKQQARAASAAVAAAEQRGMQVLGRCMRAWMCACAASRQLQHAAWVLGERRRQKLAAAILGEWHSWAAEGRALAAMSDLDRQQALLCQTYSHMTGQQVWQLQVTQMQRRVRACQLAGALRRWRLHAQAMQHARAQAAVKVLQATGRLVAAAFGAWQQLVRQRQHATRHAAEAAAQRQARQQRSIVSSWAKHAAQQRMVYAAACRLQARSSGQRMRLAWAAWAQRVGEQRRERAREARVQARMGTWRLAAALAAWRQLVATKQQRRRLQQGQLRKALAGRLRRLFTGWQQALQQEREERDQVSVAGGQGSCDHASTHHVCSQQDPQDSSHELREQRGTSKLVAPKALVKLA
jgi:hypothetical protein